MAFVPGKIVCRRRDREKHDQIWKVGLHQHKLKKGTLYVDFPLWIARLHVGYPHTIKRVKTMISGQVVRGSTQMPLATHVGRISIILP